MTVAPAALASCSVKIETPPVPSSTTTEPGPTSAARSAFQAVLPALGKVEAAIRASERC